MPGLLSSGELIVVAMCINSSTSRRSFLARAVAVGSSLALAGAEVRAADPRKPANKICAFVKFLQALSYDQLAETIAELGFDGIEATVRARGHVLPERVGDDLPRLVEALKKCGLEITVMASDVNRADHPLTEKVLRTAAGLGVKCYRMKGYRYDLKQSVVQQLAALRPVVKDLVALNRQLGLQAVYQVHSGSSNVGATVWDLYRLVNLYPVRDLGVAFDIRHATVEGGLSWPIQFNLMRPHFGVVYVKDFRWEGRRPVNVPLGAGQVDPKFFRLLHESGFTGPISLHVEYLHDAGVAENVAALKRDLETLRKSLTGRIKIS